MVKVWPADAEKEAKRKTIKNKTPCLIIGFAVSNAGIVYDSNDQAQVM
jgi:hypothetical protein